MTPWTDCPKCGGRGRRPFPHDIEACDLCGGHGEIPADFADKTARPRRKGCRASCEDCLEIRICVNVERAGHTVPLCAQCYARDQHPHLVASIPLAEIPF